MQILNTLFPTSSKELNNDIESNAKFTFKAGEVSCVQVNILTIPCYSPKGQIKFIEKAKMVCEFMYYIQPGQLQLYP
jgi:hypothetical protein